MLFPEKRPASAVSHCRMLCSVSSCVFLALVSTSVLADESNHRPLGLRISKETAPIGGMVQVKVFLTAPQPIASGKILFTFDGSTETIPRIVAAQVFSAAGDVNGLGYVDVVNEFLVVFSSPSGGVGRLPGVPLLELTFPADKARTIGVDQSSRFFDLEGKMCDLAPAAIELGGVAIGGALSVENVTPGGGIVPAGLPIQINGTAFTPDTAVSIDGVSIASRNFVSPNLITVTLAAGTEMTAKHVHVQNPDRQNVDYWCWLHDIQLSTDDFPIFPVISTFTATWGPFQESPSYIAGLAFQNPSSMPVEVTVGSELGTAAVTVPAWGVSGVPAFRNDPPGIVRHLVISSAPIRMVGFDLHAHNSFGSSLPAEYTPHSPPQIGSIVNAASLAQRAIAPGEIITIFGSGIEASSTIVLFDGVLAPLLFVGDSQVNAVVPYEVMGKSTTSVQVYYNGIAGVVRGVAVGVSVTSSAPGIFTLDASGQGQAAVLNQDGTINGLSNPAAVGSTIQIFATGEGETMPAGVTGSVTGPNPKKPVLPVKVTIGGFDAAVQFAGSAPNSVAGLLQVNVLVPQGVSPGSAVPLTLTIGDAHSPDGVTIAVK